MLTIRPIAPDDAAAFAALHGQCSEGAAHDLQRESARAFAGTGAMPQRFVFVLQDGTGPLLGAAAIAGTSGIDLPRSSYRGGTVVHASAELKMFNRLDTLLLCNDHTGCAELTLPLMASRDSSEAPQRLLIDAMLMFVAQQSDRFAGRMVAELPGLAFENGGSPFWHALGRHFVAAPLPEDDAFFRVPERSYVARLMPKHPLYSSFLGAEAHACIGKRALRARVAAEALEAQGFRSRGHINLFDAGPILEVEVRDLVAAQCRVLPVCIEAGQAGPRDGRPARRSCLIAGVGTSRFDATLVQATIEDGTLTLDSDIARSLAVVAGQRVRVMPQGERSGPLF